MSISLILKAKQIALLAHQDQLYGTESYQVHLEAVVDVLSCFGFAEESILQDNQYTQIIAAAWVHDVLEDTNTDFEFLEKELGKEIADIA